MLALLSCCAMSRGFGQVVITGGGGPQIATPEVHFVTLMSSPVGITDAGRAGISIENRIVMLEPPPASISLPVVSNPGVYVVPGIARERTRAFEEHSTGPAAPAAAPAVGVPGAAGPPLAVIVSPGAPHQPASRVYSNSDMQRLQSDPRAHISIVGDSGQSGGTAN
ncbi:MAG: hypothetical protein JO041_09440 [Acidobacteria bacterium]|nr:hypothetical protein [Acidobacteriota bacterium]